MTQIQIIFSILAILFGFLFFIFIYYLYNEKLVDNQYEGGSVALMDKSAPESKKLSKSVDSLADSTDDSVSDDQKPTSAPKKQVFNISQNKFTYPEAKAACKVFDSELATLEQLAQAYKEGADWCNYGWTEGQMAFYPTQKSTWDKLQKNSTPEKRRACGKPGINGGHFSNPELRFGVNCYGIKPSPRAQEQLKQTLKSDEDAELEAMVAKFKEDLDNINILPFNRDSWSGCGPKK
jgi:hypothetical protein